MISMKKAGALLLLATVLLSGYAGHSEAQNVIKNENTSSPQQKDTRLSAITFAAYKYIIYGKPII